VNEKKISLGSAIDQIVVALEGLEERSRLTAIHAACEFLGLKAETPSEMGEQTIHSDRGTDSYAGITPIKHIDGKRDISQQIDIRKFKDEKNPKSARQMACVVAYYLQELAPSHERKDTISTEDLEKYFKQAKYPLPEKLGQILVDVKIAGYMDSPTRGQYKLNAVGYNLVAHNLPTASVA
jgi:hypothetical protein